MKPNLVKYVVLVLFQLGIEHVATVDIANVTEIKLIGNYQYALDNQTIISGQLQIYEIILAYNVKYLRVTTSSFNATLDAQIDFVLCSASQQHEWTLPDQMNEADGEKRFSQQVCAVEDLFILEVSSFSDTPIDFAVKLSSFIVEDFFLNSSSKTIAVNLGEPYNSHIKFPQETTDNKEMLDIRLSSDSETAVKIMLRPHACDAPREVIEKMNYDHICLTMTTTALISVDKNSIPQFHIIIELSPEPRCLKTSQSDEDPIDYNPKQIISNQTKNISIQLSLREKYSWLPILYFCLTCFGLSFAVFILCVIPGSQKLLRWPHDVPPAQGLKCINSKDQVEQCESRLMNSVLKKKGDAETGENERNILKKLGTIKLNAGEAGVSGSFFFNLLIIATFYCLPALQLIFFYYHSTSSNTGNQDACFYNFECARPWGPFFAGNNIASNASYVFCGIVFVLIVRFHSGKLNWRFREIFYAMGVALALEGLLSAGYHVCPTSRSFQFDTTFMYLIAGLCTYHLFQMRHPGHDNHPHKFYGIFASAVGFVVIHFFVEDSIWRIVLVIAFFTVAIIAAFFVNLKLFYPQSIPNSSDETYWLITIFRVVHALGLAGMVAYSSYCLAANPAKFPSSLLYMFVLNLMWYTVFCIASKIARGETLVLAPITCGVLATAVWIPSLYLFSVKIKHVGATPGESRAENQKCVFLDYFDYHDVWHLGSGFGLFLCFLLLLTLDDGQDNYMTGDIVDAVHRMLDRLEDAKDDVKHMVKGGEHSSSSENSDKASNK